MCQIWMFTCFYHSLTNLNVFVDTLLRQDEDLKGLCRLLFAQRVFWGLTSDKASHDKHPILSCQRQSVQPSRECFCISVLFILPLSPLGVSAYRASRADWRKEVLASAREAWLTSWRWRRAREDFTVILGHAKSAKDGSRLTCPRIRVHTGLHKLLVYIYLRNHNTNCMCSSCGLHFIMNCFHGKITKYYLLPFKPLQLLTANSFLGFFLIVFISFSKRWWGGRLCTAHTSFQLQMASTPVNNINMWNALQLHWAVREKTLWKRKCGYVRVELQDISPRIAS